MVYKFHDIYELMPKKDCELCGYPSCSTVARKIIVGEVRPESCEIINRQNLEKIMDMLKEGVELKARGEVIFPKEGIAYIRPCVTEVGKVMAEANLSFRKISKYGFFDPYVMCEILNYCQIFESIRCSPSLGFAKISYQGKTILLFQNGKINVRKAKDQEDALDTIHFVSRATWGAIICECGNTCIDCAAGACDYCSDIICPALINGSFDPLYSITKPISQINGLTIFSKIKDLTTASIFEKGFNKLNSSFLKFMKAYKNIFNEKDLLKLPELKEVRKYAIEFVINTKRKEDATLGLILFGLSTNILRMLDGFNSLVVGENEKILKDLSSIYEFSLEIVSNAFEAFKNSNKGQAEIAINKYQKLAEECKKFEGNEKYFNTIINIKKIAINGLYIARLPTKPLPA